MRDLSKEGASIDPRQLRILKNGRSVRCPDHRKWVRWMSSHDPVLCSSRVGRFRIRTSFTGVLEKGMLWETEIRPKPRGPDPSKCSSKTRTEAIATHAALLFFAVLAAKKEQRG